MRVYQYECTSPVLGEIDLMEKLMGITFTGGSAATGEGNTTTEDDAGNVGSGVDLEEIRKNKVGQEIE